jgi:excisionase family DNA binding protein
MGYDADQPRPHERNLPVYYSFNEVAKMLRVSRQTIYRMIEDGRLPAPIKLGNAQRSSVRFEKAKVDAALAALQTGSKA